MKAVRSTLLLAAAWLAACDGPPPSVLVIRAGRLFDGSGGAVRENVRLVVRDGNIEAITPDEGPLDPTAAVIDARDLTVLPGLIDAHAHILTAGSCSLGVGDGLGQGLRNLHASLAAGVTTVADWGGPPAVMVGIRRWVGTARHRGPRLLVAGSMLTSEGGYITDLLDGELVKLGAAVPLTNPTQARTAVRDLVDADVDFIKIGLQKNHYNGQPLPLMDSATLCAAIDEAHTQEVRALVHATEQPTYTMALDCGADAFGHGAIEPLDDATLKRLQSRGLVVAPTVNVFAAPVEGPDHPELLTGAAADRVLSDEIREALARHAQGAQDDELPNFFVAGIKRKSALAAAEMLRANTQRMYEAGIVLAMASDAASCFNFLGAPAVELEQLVNTGVPPAQALRAATYGSARLHNLHDALGTLAVGYRADLIAVAGKPDQNIADIRNVKHVVVDGVEQQMDPPGAVDWITLATRILWTMLAG